MIPGHVGRNSGGVLRLIERPQCLLSSLHSQDTPVKPTRRYRALCCLYRRV